MTEAGLSAFVTLVVIMDPLGNVPIFLALSRPLEPGQRNRVAARAVIVAFALIAAFALAGAQLLGSLGVSLESLSIAGGFLLLLVALELLRGDYDAPRAGGGRRDVALVPLATPLLAGPGAIAATIVLVRQADGGELAATWAGIVAAFVVVWAVLRLAVPIGRRLSDGFIHLLSRVMGVLLAAIAVQLILGGIADWIAAHPEP